MMGNANRNSEREIEPSSNRGSNARRARDGDADLVSDKWTSGFEVKDACKAAAAAVNMQFMRRQHTAQRTCHSDLETDI